MSFNKPLSASKPISNLPNTKKVISGSNSKAIIPPVLKEVSKLAAGVATIGTGGASTSSGSATGNPRNKHALSPGHSLMDWIRLGNSGIDLTGVGHQAGKLSITPKELSKHNNRSDAWLAIRGKVFNITHYIPYHPGGEEEILKGAGMDATQLFEQVHAWVNYESLLQKCFVGRLVALDPKINAEELFFGSSKKQETDKTNLKAITSPKSPGDDAQKNSELSPRKNGNQVEKSNNSPSEFRVKFGRKHDNQDDIKFLKERMFLPRFDWIQKTDYITIVFYTKALCNPQIEIFPPVHGNFVVVILTYEEQVFTNEITFSKAINWPCQTKMHHETGKIEIIFKKSESKIWDSYGTLKQKREDFEWGDNMRNHWKIKLRKNINYNTDLFELERVDNSRLIIPLGKHVKVYGNIKGEEVSRSYTPVPQSLFTEYVPQLFATDEICLAIKRYDNGNISRYIHEKGVGDILDISKGIGSFCLKDLESREIFLLLAAGTGITPMLSLLIFLMERRIRRCQKILLVFFNQSEEDILFREELNSLCKLEERVDVVHVLSNPDSSWTGYKGRITIEITQNMIEMILNDTAYKQNDIFAMICGPNAFTQLTENFLQQVGFDRNQMHLFFN